MRYIAVWDEGDQTDITEQVRRFLDGRGSIQVGAASQGLWGRLRNLEEEEAQHKATRDYGERHEGEFHLSGAIDFGPGEPRPYVEPLGPTSDQMEEADLQDPS